MRFERGKFSVEVWQQWSEWFVRRCNWYNFSLIEISFEDDQGCGNYELQLSLVGLCARFIYLARIGPHLQIAMDRMDQIKADPSRAVSADEFLARRRDDKSE